MFVIVMSSLIVGYCERLVEGKSEGTIYSFRNDSGFNLGTFEQDRTLYSHYKLYISKPIPKSLCCNDQISEFLFFMTFTFCYVFLFMTVLVYFFSVCDEKISTPSPDVRTDCLTITQKQARHHHPETF